MLKAEIFHANALDKLPKVHDQLNTFLGKQQDDAIISINATELGYSGIQQFYSYTVLVIYKASG